jgi:hypothetical protein
MIEREREREREREKEIERERCGAQNLKKNKLICICLYATVDDRFFTIIDPKPDPFGCFHILAVIWIYAGS